VRTQIQDIDWPMDAETHLARLEGRYRGPSEAAPDAMGVVNQGGERKPVDNGALLAVIRNCLGESNEPLPIY
jgi:hypothetical protein